MAVSCEILGFSHKALLPVFARDILAIGASGLGILTASQSLGGFLAALALSAMGDARRKGRLILGIFLFFGLFMAAFARSPWYAASLVLCGLVGAMAAAFDTMQHTMLQLSVAEIHRGRAMGIWQLSIGFGPVGSIATGAIAAVLGAPDAVTINAAAIVVIFLLLMLFARRLRQA
jgi:MFS family permease